MTRSLVAVTVVALGVALVGACRDNPSIDGSKVPPVSPDCPSVCQRLVALCGYAPQGSDCTDDAGAGYCDTQIAPDYLACFATAPSCEAAWSCFDTVDVPGADAAVDDAPADDAPTDDAPAGDAAASDATAE